MVASKYSICKIYIYKYFTYISGGDSKYLPVSELLIENMILSVEESRHSYGYEISQTVKKAADIKESTLYPILKKLQSAGYLTTYSQEYQGRKRKYYSLTEEGKAQIAYLSNEWQIYKDTVDGIIEGRIRG